MQKDGSDRRDALTVDAPEKPPAKDRTAEMTRADASEVLPTQVGSERAPVGDVDPIAAILPLLDDRAVHRLRRRGVVGTGGMGIVRKVFDEALRRTAAMKTIHFERWESEQTRRLFLREARVMAQLDHPNVVPVHEIGLGPDGRLFFTMKLVGGRTLKDAVKALPEGPLSRGDLMDVLDVVVKVCHALAYAHARGVVHRDVKPSNVMIGDYGEVYLMDWGLAKVLSEPDPEPDPQPAAPHRSEEGTPRIDDDVSQPGAPSLAGSVVGTPPFMAPEQAGGLAVDARTDVFAVGALLYHLLTRRPPYDGDSLWATLCQAALARYPDLEEAAPGPGPPTLASIVRRAMAREPDDRYPSVEALREDLVRFLRGDVAFPRIVVTAGEMILREGEAGDAAYRILRGRCEAFLQRDGARQTLRVMGPGEGFGETALFRDGGLRSANVAALEEVELEVVTRALFEEELASMKPWMAGFVRDLAERFAGG
ncbi:MAG: protein kinase [Myxococcota bacterium]